ncbi:MAG: zinc metallopeptidase [Thermoflexales bacterium]|nr:zinc metallopeptidase [Thermoflexales bacterium]
MFYFDPLYLVFSLPALILALVAQWRVKSAFSKFSQVRTYRGLSGAQVARAMLNENQLQDVTVEETHGLLSDHYDPRSRALRLSSEVYRSNSVASVGVAAHEAGHALQHAQGYSALQARTAIVPVVQFGSWLGPLVFMLGFILSLRPVAWLGVALFGVVVVFSLVTLPVEFDASRRAKAWLGQGLLLEQGELAGVAKVLDAAALTYVAALAQSVSTMLYYVFLLSGARSRD